MLLLLLMIIILSLLLSWLLLSLSLLLLVIFVVVVVVVVRATDLSTHLPLSWWAGCDQEQVSGVYSMMTNPLWVINDTTFETADKSIQLGTINSLGWSILLGWTFWSCSAKQVKQVRTVSTIVPCRNTNENTLNGNATQGICQYIFLTENNNFSLDLSTGWPKVFVI